MQCMKKRQARERDKLENSKIQQGPVNNNNGSSSSIARLTRKRRNIPYEVRIQSTIDLNDKQLHLFIILKQTVGTPQVGF